MTDVNLDISGNLDPIINNTSTILTPISQGIAGAFAFVLQKPIEYGIVKEIENEALAKATRDKFNLVPQENIDFSNIPLLTKLLEDSIYQLSSEEFRDLYSSLFVSSIDKTKTVKPFYSSLIREMSYDELELLEYMFKYNILIQINLSSDNPIFIKENTHRNYWNPKYFELKGDISNRFNLRDYNDPHWEDIYKINEHFFGKKVDEPFNFLLSHGIIQENPSEYWNEFFPSIKKYVLETDENNKKVESWNYSEQKIEFLVDRKIYSLSELGSSLKTILTAYDHDDLNQ